MDTYPVQLEIDRPERLSRLLIFVKWLLAIPHFIALFFLGIGAVVATVVSWFAVLIAGRYPRGLFDFVVGVHRWGLRVAGYLFLLTDVYPAFSLDDDRRFPVRLTVEYPERIERWRPLVDWLLVLPVAIVSGLMMYVAYAVVFITWFVILFTAQFPDGLFKIVVVALRWQTNVNFYAYWMTRVYPSLSWE